MTKNLSLMIVLLCCSGISGAQPRPELCLPDADGDGHPLFGNPQIRTGFEVMPGGLNGFSDATSVTFADLDGDGDLDAAVTSIQRGFLISGVYYVTVLMNRGDAVFDPPVEYQAGVEPTHVIAIDVDGDGFADLAVANASDNTVSILLNNGDGTFAADTKFAVGEMPRSLVSADFDGDGNIDIASLNTISHDVSVMRSLGDGTFAPEQRIFVGGVTPRAIGFSSPGPFMACGDLNGDGEADLAVPTKDKIKLLLGDGSGGFTLAAQHALVEGFNYAVVMGDLDGDGDNDLATVEVDQVQGGESLSVVLNDGSGLFGPATTYSVAHQPSPGAYYRPRSLALGDLEGDGDLDLAIGYFHRQLVMIFRNNGDGSLAPKETVPVHDGPWFVAWADVNGDGETDLAVLATRVRSKLAIALNDGDGDLITQEETPEHFKVGTTFPWVSPTSVASADLDGDGDQDLAVSIGAHEDQSNVTVMFNDGDGSFDRIVPYTLGPVGESWAEHVIISDFNSDGIPDLGVADLISVARYTDDGIVWILMGTGGGNFAPATPYQLSSLYPMHIATGDLDGDGDTDLALWTLQFHPGNNTTPVDRRVVIMLNDGKGVFEFAGEHVIGSAEWLLPIGSVEIGDLDGDGDLDLAATMGARHVGGSLMILTNDGSASFTALPTLPLGPQPESVAIADLDRDGDLDLAVLHDHNHSLEVVLNEPYLTILFNDGLASFTKRTEFIDNRTIAAGTISAADLNGDGELDLVLPSVLGAVEIRLNRGEAEFEKGVHYGAGELPEAVAVADFDGDDRIDIVTANKIHNNITLLRNLGCPPCTADCDKSTGNGVLDIFDFLCFQDSFVNGEPYACDCDTLTGPLVCDIFDFLCFQDSFVAGCP